MIECDALQLLTGRVITRLIGSAKLYSAPVRGIGQARFVSGNAAKLPWVLWSKKPT